MTAAAELRVCFATKESMGNSPDDYVDLNIAFNAIAPASFSPNRTSETSAQQISVTGGSSSDEVAWVHGSDCLTTAGRQSSTKTIEYVMTANQTIFTLPTDLLPGAWQLCYRLGSDGRAGQGLWTSVTGLGLTIIPLPTYSPHVGVAGSITPITINGSLDRDVIVIQPNDCSNAHLTTDTNATLGKTPIASDIISTSHLMTEIENSNFALLLPNHLATVLTITQSCQAA